MMETDTQSDREGRIRRRGERGSALILVLLILLALSAIGMLALQDVTRSIQQSGQFRVRTTASTFSDAVAQFMHKRLGDKASQYWNMMKTGQEFDMSGTGSTKMANRKQVATQGGWIKLQQIPGHSDDKKRDFDNILGSSSDETGIFTGGSSTVSSFELNEKGTQFEVVIRDPVDGIPVPGYSDKFCFKKMTVATRTQVGDMQDSWTRPRQVAEGRTMFEGLVGPMECGN